MKTQFTLKCYLFFFGVLLMSFAPKALTLNSKENILTAYTIADIQKALSQLDKDTVIFIDVDDTLITPESKVFHWSSPYRFLIDDLKKNKDKYPNFKTILSHWRLQRKTILVSKDWPSFIESLKEQYPVYALTKMDSGAFGDIPSMEKWRYDELIAKGISFTPSYDGISEGIVATNPKKASPATFYKGIFITGALNKSEVLRAYFNIKKPHQIILIDDRPEYLEDAIEECNRHHIPFLGILFKGMDQIPGSPDPKVAEFQKETLFEKGQWLEDSEAEKLVAR